MFPQKKFILGREFFGKYKMGILEILEI